MFDEFLRTDRVARIQHRAADNRAHHRQVFQPHLRRTVLADADADVRAGEFQVRLRNARDADLIVSAREETGERGCKWHLAARAEADGHTNHVLLGNETFGEPLGEFLHEFFRVGGILCIAVHRDDALVRLAHARERIAISFARGNRITGLVADRRVAGGRGVVGSGQLIRRGNGDAGSRFCTRLEFGDGLDSFLLAQRFAVPAVPVLQK